MEGKGRGKEGRGEMGREGQGERREGRRRKGRGREGRGGGPSGDVADQAFCLKSAPDSYCDLTFAEQFPGCMQNL